MRAKAGIPFFNAKMAETSAVSPGSWNTAACSHKRQTREAQEYHGPCGGFGRPGPAPANTPCGNIEREGVRGRPTAPTPHIGAGRQAEAADGGVGPGGGARPQGCSGHIVLGDGDDASAGFVEGAEPDYTAAAAVGEKFSPSSKGDVRSCDAAVKGIICRGCWSNDDSSATRGKK
jgi:hypothetical protein